MLYCCNTNQFCILGRLTDDEVKRLWQQAEIFKEDDQKNKERVKAKDDLEIYAINAISIADRTLSDSKKRRIDEECDEVLLWIEDHRVCLTLPIIPFLLIETLKYFHTHVTVLW